MAVQLAPKSINQPEVTKTPDRPAAWSEEEKGGHAIDEEEARPLARSSCYPATHRRRCKALLLCAYKLWLASELRPATRLELPFLPQPLLLCPSSVPPPQRRPGDFHLQPRRRHNSAGPRKVVRKNVERRLPKRLGTESRAVAGAAGVRSGQAQVAR